MAQKSSHCDYSLPPSFHDCETRGVKEPKQPNKLFGRTLNAFALSAEWDCKTSGIESTNNEALRQPRCAEES